ncbi:MAG: CoA transferase [Burkholderiales bacterium]|nr:CoA transferase [Burkholderiales bacterium]
MDVTPAAEPPLARYRVLDLTIARAGPAAVRLLADWGAEVIRIEPPPARDGGSMTGRRRGPDEQNLHRNKRSLCLDLKSEAGRVVLRRLVERSDVLVENFRSDVKQRLGLDYETLARINPRLILASISGFGQDGPYADRPGVDQVVQGLSGLMSITGEPGRGPMRVGIAVSDTTAGMFLGQGILLALLQREHTGRGQWVHTSLLESMLNKLDFQAARYTMSGEVAGQEGNAHPTLTPMGCFAARDGLVNIAASTAKMWAGLCRALEAQHLLDHPDYQDVRARSAHRRQLDADIEAVTRRFSVAELVQRLNANDVPCGPIHDIGQAFEDPQVRHLRMTRPAPHPELGALQLLRSPINLSACPHPEQFDRAGPDPGQHSTELLRETGFSDTDIARLRAEGTIA